MILIRLNLTELAAGQLAINEFCSELERAWMPGFSRSYERRQEAYLKAYQRYEERNLFLRLLFRKPKQPQRPPPGYGKELIVRLRQDWLDSLHPAPNTALSAASANDNVRLVKVVGTQSFLDFLSGFLDDRYFALANLQAHPQSTADVLIAGPSGIWLFELCAGHGRPLASENDDNLYLSLLANWSHTAEAIGATLQARAQLDPATISTLLPLKGGVIYKSDQEQRQLQAEPSAAVRIGRQDDCRRWLEETSASDDIEQQTIFQILDSLLSRHQELHHLDTVSAVTKAQKLMKQEKDELLRLAATL